ncbi:hypothetical protein D3C84_330720 [compost metagenome]
MLTGVGVRHPAHALPRWRHPGQARQTKVWGGFPGSTVAVGDPLPVKQQLPVEHQGTADFHHDLMPLAGVVTRRPELIRDTGAPDHRHRLIDQ